MLTIRAIKQEGAVVDARRIANNTAWIKYDDGQEAYRLHNTDIVTYHQNGLITINTGGWYSPTTKDRINRYLPDHIGITQRNWNWYLSRATRVDLPGLCEITGEPNYTIEHTDLFCYQNECSANKVTIDSDGNLIK